MVDGDTVDLTNGARVRLVQIDTLEVYYSPECYGEQASAYVAEHGMTVSLALVGVLSAGFAVYLVLSKAKMARNR